MCYFLPSSVLSDIPYLILHVLLLSCLLFLLCPLFPSLLTHCSVFFLSVPLLQVMQLQSGQSYQNKAVPFAALLFVYMERANALPVSPLCNLASSKPRQRHSVAEVSVDSFQLTSYITRYFSIKVQEKRKGAQGWSRACVWQHHL